MLESLKTVVVQCAQEAETQGLCRWRSGNFSARDEGTGLICVTPSGVDRRTMKPDDIVVMDCDAQVVESINGRKPSSEALMHLAAYEERLERPIPGLVLEAAHIRCANGTIPVAAFAPQGTAALADSVRAPLRTGDALLLARHGALTVGVSLDDALLKAAYVEELAEVAYRAAALLGGAEPAALPPEAFTLRYPEKIKLAKNQE